ncbi:MAG: hypothetical protein ACHQRM_00290 [Bacteroidia bacterium]
MKISINDHRKVFGIQKAFAALFPHLLLAFFAKSAHAGAAGPDHMVGGSKTVGQCRSIHNKGTITVTPGMTPAELINHFRDVFGLNVCLLHKVDGNWKEIPAGNKFTLGEIDNPELASIH